MARQTLMPMKFQLFFEKTENLIALKYIESKDVVDNARHLPAISHPLRSQLRRFPSRSLGTAENVYFDRYITINAGTWE